MTSKENGKNQQEKPGKMKRKEFERELEKLQIELVKLQRWVVQEGLRVVIVFEGRDAAGKGGTIDRIVDRLSHRVLGWWHCPNQLTARKPSCISSAT